MGTILFVAELGGGFGHVRRLLPIARAAAAAGHRPIFLVPNPVEVSSVMTHERILLRPAPQMPRPLRQQTTNPVAHSFADILGRAGFGDSALLQAAAHAWDVVLTELRPVAAVCEFSPFFMMATHGGQLPVLSLGHGFILPPPHLPHFPALVSTEPSCSEKALLDAVRTALRARGQPLPAALPALFGGSAHFVTGLEALDPYSTLRVQAAVGPPGVEPLGVQLEKDGLSEELFVYLLGSAPCTLAILRALRASGLAGRAYVRQGGEPHREALAGSRITYLPRPEPIGDALARARLVVHHGSMLTAEETLLAGRAQLLVPLYLEHLLTARALASMGAAHVLRASAVDDSFAAAVERAWSDRTCNATAMSFACSYRETAMAPRQLSMRLLATVLGGPAT